jgi:hypothetical protein
MMHYPHVRPMMQQPLECRMEGSIAIPNADALVVKAFRGAPVHIAQLPMSIVPTRPFEKSVDKAVPIPSFYSWGSIHHSLTKIFSDRFVVGVPFSAVNQDGICGARWNCYIFEQRCFQILAYFLGVFGPIEGSLRNEFLDHLDQLQDCPLRGWFPRAAFSLRKTVTLEHPKGRSNPSDVMRHEKMADGNLVDDFVEPVRGLSQKISEAAWFWCGGSAPIDFILVFTLPPTSPKGSATLHLRFADAKHSNTDHWGSADLAEMEAKAKKLHQAVAKGLRRAKVTLAVAPFDKRHLMLCYNREGSAMLSPSTFTWEPWSPLLFCPDAGPRRT